MTYTEKLTLEEKNTEYLRCNGHFKSKKYTYHNITCLVTVFGEDAKFIFITDEGRTLNNIIMDGHNINYDKDIWFQNILKFYNTSINVGCLESRIILPSYKSDETSYIYDKTSYILTVDDKLAIKRGMYNMVTAIRSIDYIYDNVICDIIWDMAIIKTEANND